MGKNAWEGHAAMFSANLMWGLMSPLAKVVMVSGVVTPLVLNDLRIFGAAVLFWIVSWFSPAEHVPRKDLAKLFGASLLAIVFNQGCFIFGVGLTSPSDASIISTSMPLWAMVLAAFFLKEPITGKKIAGIVAGACGALLLILGEGKAAADSQTGSSVWGDLLVLTAQLSYASYIVLFKHFVGRYSLVTIMKWMFLFAAVCVLPFSAGDLWHTSWMQLDGSAAGAIAFIVVGATFFSYILVVVGQKTLRPTVAGMYNYIQPLVACAVAVWLGLDNFGATKVLAAVLIFSGVYLVTASRSRAETEASTGKDASRR